MAIDDAARVAVTRWNRADAIIMVAICGAESGYRAVIAGDSFFSLACYRAQGYGIPCDLENVAFKQIYDQVVVENDAYDCNEYLSFGPWQIHTSAHHSHLRAVTGSDDPCQWAEYLYDWDNNAAVAAHVLSIQGFGAWTTYNNRSYRAYLHEAEVAVDAALEEVAPPPGPPPPGPPPLPPVGPAVSLLYVSPVAPPGEAEGAFRYLEPVEPPRG